MPSDPLKLREILRENDDDEPMEWESELDSALADIDSRLLRPRRASAVTSEPRHASAPRPVELSPEMLDELASRVAQRLRSARATEAMNAPIAITLPATHPWGDLREDAPSREEQVRADAVLVIRFRWPLFWSPLRLIRRYRRRRHYVTGAPA